MCIYVSMIEERGNENKRQLREKVKTERGRETHELHRRKSLLILIIILCPITYSWSKNDLYHNTQNAGKERERERKHNLIKANYQNIFHADSVRKLSDAIHSRGGKTALQQDYSTLLTFLGTWLIDQRGLSNIKTIASKLWDGIGEDDEKWKVEVFTLMINS